MANESASKQKTTASRTVAALVPQGVLAGQPDVPLDRPVTTVGSGEQNRLQLSSRTVSRSHALLVKAWDTIYVIDLASRTGLQVNGSPVREHDLSNGDRIQVGKFVFRYRTAAVATVPGAKNPAPPAVVIRVGSPPIRIAHRSALIGRRENCDIVLPEESGASNVHAVLFQVDHNWVLVDLESRMGTAVNGTSITQQVIKFGDRLTIGAETILFQPAGTLASEPPAKARPVSTSAPLELERFPVEVEPLAVEPLPVSIETEPVAVEAEPVAVEAEPFAVEAEPVAVEAEPFAVEGEPLAVEPEPVLSAAEPIPVDWEPIPVELEPTAVEPGPVPIEAEPLAIEVEPFLAEPEPVLLEAELVPEAEPLPEAEPVPVDWEPLPIEVEPLPVAHELEPVEVFDPSAASTADIPHDLIDLHELVEPHADLPHPGQELTDTTFGRMVDDFGGGTGPLVEAHGVQGSSPAAEKATTTDPASPDFDIDSGPLDFDFLEEIHPEEISLPLAETLKPESILDDRPPAEEELAESLMPVEVVPPTAVETADKPAPAAGDEVELAFFEEVHVDALDPGPAGHAETPAAVDALEVEATPLKTEPPEPASAIETEIVPAPVVAGLDAAAVETVHQDPKPLENEPDLLPVDELDFGGESAVQTAPAIATPTSVPPVAKPAAAAAFASFDDLEDFVFVPDASPLVETPDLLFFGDEDPDEIDAAVLAPAGEKFSEPPRSLPPPAGPTGGVNDDQAAPAVPGVDAVVGSQPVVVPLTRSAGEPSETGAEIPKAGDAVNSEADAEFSSEAMHAPVEPERPAEEPASEKHPSDAEFVATISSEISELEFATTSDAEVSPVFEPSAEEAPASEPTEVEPVSVEPPPAIDRVVSDEPTSDANTVATVSPGFSEPEPVMSTGDQFSAAHVALPDAVPFQEPTDLELVSVEPRLPTDQVVADEHPSSAEFIAATSFGASDSEVATVFSAELPPASEPSAEEATVGKPIDFEAVLAEPKLLTGLTVAEELAGGAETVATIVPEISEHEPATTSAVEHSSVHQALPDANPAADSIDEDPVLAGPAVPADSGTKASDAGFSEHAAITTSVDESLPVALSVDETVIGDGSGPEPEAVEPFSSAFGNGDAFTLPDKPAFDESAEDAGPMMLVVQERPAAEPTDPVALVPELSDPIAFVDDFKSEAHAPALDQSIETYLPFEPTGTGLAALVAGEYSNPTAIALPEVVAGSPLELIDPISFADDSNLESDAPAQDESIGTPPPFEPTGTGLAVLADGENSKPSSIPEPADATDSESTDPIPSFHDSQSEAHAPAFDEPIETNLSSGPTSTGLSASADVENLNSPAILLPAEAAGSATEINDPIALVNDLRPEAATPVLDDSIHTFSPFETADTGLAALAGSDFSIPAEISHRAVDISAQDFQSSSERIPPVETPLEGELPSPTVYPEPVAVVEHLDPVAAATGLPDPGTLIAEITPLPVETGMSSASALASAMAEAAGLLLVPAASTAMEAASGAVTATIVSNSLLPAGDTTTGIIEVPSTGPSHHVTATSADAEYQVTIDTGGQIVPPTDDQPVWVADSAIPVETITPPDVAPFETPAGAIYMSPAVEISGVSESTAESSTTEPDADHLLDAAPTGLAVDTDTHPAVVHGPDDLDWTDHSAPPAADDPFGLHADDHHEPPAGLLVDLPGVDPEPLLFDEPPAAAVPASGDITLDAIPAIESVEGEWIDDEIPPDPVLESTALIQTGTDDPDLTSSELEPLDWSVGEVEGEPIAGEQSLETELAGATDVATFDSVDDSALSETVAVETRFGSAEVPGNNDADESTLQMLDDPELLAAADDLEFFETLDQAPEMGMEPGPMTAEPASPAEVPELLEEFVEPATFPAVEELNLPGVTVSQPGPTDAGGTVNVELADALEETTTITPAVETASETAPPVVQLPRPQTPSAAVEPPPAAPPKPRGPSLFGFQFEGGSFLGGMPLPLPAGGSKSAPVATGAIAATSSVVATGAAVATGAVVAGVAATVAAATAATATITGAGSAVAAGVLAPAVSVAVPAVARAPSTVFDSKAVKPSGLSSLAGAPSPAAPPAARRPAAPPQVIPPHQPSAPKNAPLSLTGLKPGPNPADPMMGTPLPPVPMPGVAGQFARPLPKRTLARPRTADIFSQAETPIGVEVFGGPVVPLQPVDLSAEIDAEIDNAPVEPFSVAAPKKKLGPKVPILLLLILTLPAGLWWVVNRYVPTTATVVGSVQFDGLTGKSKQGQDNFIAEQKKRLESDELRQAAAAILASRGKPAGVTGDPVKYAEAIDLPTAISAVDGALQLSLNVPQEGAGREQVQAILTALVARDSDLASERQTAIEARTQAHVATVAAQKDYEKNRADRLKAASEAQQAPSRIAVEDQEAVATNAEGRAADARIRVQSNQAFIESIRKQDTTKAINPESDAVVMGLRQKIKPLQDQVDAMPKKVPGSPELASGDLIDDKVRGQLADLKSQLNARLEALKSDANLTPAERQLQQDKLLEENGPRQASVEASEKEARQIADIEAAKASQMRSALDKSKREDRDVARLITEEQEKNATYQTLLAEEKAKVIAEDDTIDIRPDSVTATVDPASVTNPRPGITYVGGGLIVLVLGFMIAAEFRQTPAPVAVIRPAAAPLVHPPRRIVPWPQPEQLAGLEESVAAERAADF